MDLGIKDSNARVPTTGTARVAPQAWKGPAAFSEKAGRTESSKPQWGKDSGLSNDTIGRKGERQKRKTRIRPLEGGGLFDTEGPFRIVCRPKSPRLQRHTVSFLLTTEHSKTKVVYSKLEPRERRAGSRGNGRKRDAKDQRYS